jgi:hypothetical protein
LNVPDVAVELDVGPRFRDIVVESLEIGDSFGLVVQLPLLCLDRSRGLRIPGPLLLRLQPDNVAGPKVSENAAIGNGLRNLVEAALESAHSAHPNMVPGCATSVLVVHKSVFAKNMAIADPVDLVAGVAILVSVLVEPERKSALGIHLLPFFCRKGNGEKRGEKATDVMGGIAAVDMAHKGGTCEPLQDRLAPFHNDTLDSVPQEKGEDLSGDLVGGIGGGRARSDTDPNDDGAESPLHPLSQRRVSEKAGWVDRRPVDLPYVKQVTNLGTDSVPDTIERGVEDPAERLDGEMGVSADGLGEGRTEEVGTINEVRVVTVPGDAVIIRRPLVLVGAVLGDNGVIAGEGKGGGGGETGRRSRRETRVA